jgi:hypothetical protein
VIVFVKSGFGEERLMISVDGYGLEVKFVDSKLNLANIFLFGCGCILAHIFLKSF